MAVYIKTNKPKELLDELKTLINKGSIDTWSYDSDGDFTHNVNQWVNKAWFRPHVESERIVFGILGNKETTMTKQLYGLYHGRFIEMMLAHFDEKINLIWPSVMKSLYDNFS